MKIAKSLLAALLMAVAVFGTIEVKADSALDPIGSEPAIMLPMIKLGRGISNAAFGVFEIPKAWWEVQNDMGGIAGLTYGTLKGVCYFLAREVVGVVEILTFPFPLPGCPNNPLGAGAGYGPIMFPAWVIDINTDWNNFVYGREAVLSPAL
jgi:putative exosortase-associated protein (TIGR04073 family)